MEPSQRDEHLGAAERAMTPAELVEAKRYGREKLTWSLVTKALELIGLALMTLVIVRPLDAALSSELVGRWGRLLLILGTTAALEACLCLPIAFYSGFVIEHRYGLSRQSLAAWAWRELKQGSLGLLLMALMVSGLYALIWWLGPLWWLAAAGGVFLLSVVLGQLAPVLILPLFYKVERMNNPELSDRIGRLAAGTGLAVEGVYRLVLSSETAKANAMLAGLGHTRRVLLGDTLVDQFSPDEVEVVLAHEIGHHVFHHIPKMIAGGLVASLAGFWIVDRLLGVWQGAYAPQSLSPSSLPFVMLVLSLLSLVFEPLQNAISRVFERQCDRYALVRTGSREAYRSAFQKLARLNKSDPNPPRLEVLLFHSHPPIAERLALAE